jgi:hypothetical protein
MKRLKISITVLAAAMATSGTIAAKAGFFSSNIAKAAVTSDCYRQTQLLNPSATLPDEGSVYTTQTFFAAGVAGGVIIDSNADCLNEPSICCYLTTSNPNQDPETPNDEFIVTLVRGQLDL